MSKETNDAWVNAHYGHDAHPISGNNPAAATGIALGLRRYEPESRWDGAGMKQSANGEYVKASDVSDRIDASLKGGRYFCDGPEGHFFCYDLKLARALVNSYDKYDNWTITDLKATSVDMER